MAMVLFAFFFFDYHKIDFSLLMKGRPLDEVAVGALSEDSGRKASFT